MIVVAVCVARPRELAWRGKTRVTGIFKEAVAGPVEVVPEGLAGDHILNRRHHGGPDKAVYSYAEEHHAYWAPLLPGPFAAGAFGENLLTRGLDESAVRVGDRFRIGSAILEARQGREPCATLAARYGDEGLVKRFAESERYGIYYRVIEPGSVRAGDAIVRISRGEGETTAALTRRKLSR